MKWVVVIQKIMSSAAIKSRVTSLDSLMKTLCQEWSDKLHTGSSLLLTLTEDKTFLNLKLYSLSIYNIIN